jgi:hypothetical protein
MASYGDSFTFNFLLYCYGVSTRESNWVIFCCCLHLSVKFYAQLYEYLVSTHIVCVINAEN